MEEVKEDLRALLISASNGLSIQQLDKDYYNITGSNIPYGRFGYSSLHLFLKSIPDALSIVGHGKYATAYPVVTRETEHIDFMVQKQRKPTKKRPRFRYKALDGEVDSSDSSQYTINKLNEERMWNPPVPQKTKSKKSDSDYSVPSLPSTIPESFPGEAIPDIDSENEIFYTGYPLDALRRSTDIHFHERVSDIIQPINGFYPVKITHIRTPYKFWFTLQFEGQHNELKEELQDFYEQLDDDELLLPEIDIKTKRVCAARFKGIWCRAEIVSDEPNSDGDFKVFRLDQGDIVHVNPKFMKYLMKQFGKIPRQVYRGRLAYVKPKRMRWSKSASEKFEEITNGCILYAKIEHFDPDDQCHYLSLLHTYTEKDVDIGQYLAVKCHDVGLTENVQGKQSLALKIPTFYMLEHGLTPLSSEFDY
uniref:CSON003116 protein n=1 Tax=Culicoides sonorensis TaxID=179676 RepID=A0A336LW60_CULSO